MIKIVHNIYGGMFIIIHRPVISLICRMNTCEIQFFCCIYLIDVTVIACMVNYFLWVFMILNFLTRMVLMCFFIIDTKTSLYIYYVCKVSSGLNKLLFWTLLRRNFYVPITFLFLDVFKLFDSLLLICGIMVVHLLFLYLEKPSCNVSFLIMYTPYIFIFLL